MTDYKASEVMGSAWTRAQQVTIDNPMTGPKYATFSEERVLSIGGETVRQPAGSCRLTMDDDSLDTAFDLLHPETGTVIGSTTYAQAYVMLYSLYMHAAKLRDEKAAEDAAAREAEAAARAAEGQP